MAVTDPIADYLTSIRNAQMAGHKIVEIPASNVKKHMTEILYDQGYILKYKFEDGVGKGKQGIIKIALKYDPVSKTPVIKKMIRVSKPGLRQYVGSKNLPRVINGLGIAIISTSHGLLTDKQAGTQNLGGEVLCYIY
jgi:small subunit ribosomal protein S8